MRSYGPGWHRGFSMLAILAALALVVWILNSYLPIKQRHKTIANICVIAVVLAWLALLVFYRLFPPHYKPPALNY